MRLALTATANKRVAQDIVERLNIKVQNIVQLPSSRKNLILSVRSFSYPSDGYGEKLDALLDALPGLANGGSAIIYVNKQNLAERLALDLRDNGYSARAYHSKISNREEVEHWFLKKHREADGAPIVVGTTAFGMGIDKSDVRSVIHFDMPRSVEDYVQGVYDIPIIPPIPCCIIFATVVYPCYAKPPTVQHEQSCAAQDVISDPRKTSVIPLCVIPFLFFCRCG